MESSARKILFRYRLVLGLFIAGLVLSGITAFPLESEIAMVDRFLGPDDYIGPPLSHVDFTTWIKFVHYAVHETYTRFPLFGYATDWLAFGHIVIAAFFILPFLDPIRYRAVLHVGVAACAGVILIAVVCGPLRGIPLFWRLIDCSFGVIGALPLVYCTQLARKMSKS
jgi:hypothetical protein